MSNLKLPGEEEDDKKRVSLPRLTIWLVVAAFGIFYIISGLTGMMS